MIKRTITTRDIENAARLKAVYTAKKKQLKLNQTTLGQRIGFEQATVSQYMNATIAMNLSAIMKFASALDVKPQEIDPSIKGSLVAALDPRIVGVRYTTSGKRPEVNMTSCAYIKVTDTCFAIEVDCDTYEPWIPQGSMLIADPGALLQHNDMVALFQKGSSVPVIARMTGWTDTNTTVLNLADGMPWTFASDDLDGCHKVLGIENPKS